MHKSGNLHLSRSEGVNSVIIKDHNYIRAEVREELHSVTIQWCSRDQSKATTSNFSMLEHKKLLVVD